MRADVLLVAEDGVPIVGEIKAATSTGYDTDPVLALVQGLAACAQLLPPQQMERLAKAYPFAQFRAVGVLDLFVIVVKPELAARDLPGGPLRSRQSSGADPGPAAKRPGTTNRVHRGALQRPPRAATSRAWPRPRRTGITAPIIGS